MGELKSLSLWLAAVKRSGNTAFFPFARSYEDALALVENGLPGCRDCRGVVKSGFLLVRVGLTNNAFISGNRNNGAEL